MLTLYDVPVVDTFAEAFTMRGTRVVITAVDLHWAETAAREFCGHASSVIGCDAEVAIERMLPPDETPDGRPGMACLAFAFDQEALGKAVVSRVAQNVLTCPTTACYGGIDPSIAEGHISVGGALRYFGDGWQRSKLLDGRRFWRVPVMDGEFVCEDRIGFVKGVGGGNLLICGTDAETTLYSTAAAVAAVREQPGSILPFPGGIVRSGSKVGSRYKKLVASTNEAYAPTVRPLVESELPAECQCVYEIVVDGLSYDDVRASLRAGLHAACVQQGVVQVTAGNYGGKLGKHHFHLRDLL